MSQAQPCLIPSKVSEGPVPEVAGFNTISDAMLRDRRTQLEALR